MPTKYRRIAVIEDPELAAVLSEAAMLEPGVSRTRLLRDLALRGARSLLAEQRDDDEAIERLIAWSTGKTDRGDLDLLIENRDEAWGVGR